MRKQQLSKPAPKATVVKVRKVRVNALKQRKAARRVLELAKAQQARVRRLDAQLARWDAIKAQPCPVKGHTSTRSY